jgi:hypothetical protein
LYLAERVKSAAPEWIPATVPLRELRALGYQGGITVLKEHLGALRPLAKPEPLIRFETQPGRQMRVDLPPFGAEELIDFRYSSRPWVGAVRPTSNSSSTSGSRRCWPVTKERSSTSAASRARCCTTICIRW